MAMEVVNCSDTSRKLEDYSYNKHVQLDSYLNFGQFRGVLSHSSSNI